MSILAADYASLSLGDPGTVIAGITQRRMTLSRGLVDVTHQASGAWQENASRRFPAKAEVRAEGHFVSSAGQATLRSTFLGGESEVFRLTLQGEGVWSGLFFVQTLTLNGRAEAEMSFSVRLQSTGPLTFTAVS